ncbi:hypothetical protein M409DRAFT_36339 [Zasmidium cellare ATCC 36951]|uniref:Uncharacterized protein n=1 Tax=Zasmidium cellare ATCC 36951 TaxID=1080233 RepID=A0A6A6CS69_ZASCE|nr:uncharacterized protein M409DRAFT_36339 [Zasmidium cellare ATCC 36951]KAF2168672.1 hypothetical protein M409DRAFT_36339 [Zasmidium cellare ATCC 36951]
MAPLTWLITGCASGFGLELAYQLLARGDKVIATSRTRSKIVDLEKQGATIIEVDPTLPDGQVKSVVEAGIKEAGAIDVLVNNAAYMLSGANEVLTAEEWQSHFDVNVFGALRMLRTVLPHLRRHRSGTIVNMGSLSGWEGHPGSGAYNATKFAIAGISESLKLELAPFGIEVVCIEPGTFRTTFLSPEHRHSSSSKIEDYEALTNGMREALDAYHQTQVGDPVKGARVIIEAVTRTGPFSNKESLPARMTLGSDAAEAVRQKLRALSESHEMWSPLTSDTDW